MAAVGVDCDAGVVVSLGWSDEQERYYHSLLLQAIEDNQCPYCGAEPGDRCVTVKGRAPGTPWPGLCHVGRVHAGHELLLEVGDPIFPREQRRCAAKNLTTGGEEG